MKMMPGDFKAMIAIKGIKVMKAKQAEQRMIMKAKARMSEGYANARSKLLAEAAEEARSSIALEETKKRMLEGYATARANLLVEAAEKARASTARSSIARSSTDRFDCCDVDDFDDPDVERKRPIYHSKVSDAIVEAEGHESHAASTTP